MYRFLSLLVICLAGSGAATAGGEALKGNWKLTFFDGEKQTTFWLLQFDGKEAKAISLKGFPPTRVEELKAPADLVAFNLEVRKGSQLNFEGPAPRPGAKKIFGTLKVPTKVGHEVVPAVMEATTATSEFELNKELIQRTPSDPRVFSAIIDVLKAAKKEKAAAAEVKDMVEAVLKTAELYGPRFFDDFSFSLVEGMEKDFPPQAAALAKKVVAGLDPKAADTRLRFMTLLASALRKSDQVDEAKAVEAGLEKIESEAYLEHQKTALEFKLDKFEGRKGKSTRAVLVELFTGAQCPPCVAADMAFDALQKTYPTSDVVLLQYHLHVPEPDALTNADTNKRAKYYSDFVRGTPAIVVDGKKGPPVGGFRVHAEDGYQTLRKELIPFLETPEGATIKLTATRSGDKIDIKAEVKNLSTPGENTRLRFMLVEDWVRYKGSNGMVYHHRVVRDMPGGSVGVALTKKDSDHSASVDLVELRDRLTKYLDDYEKTEDPFPDNQRPMRFRSLSVVAVVQNDATRDVLQSADAPVK